MFNGVIFQGIDDCRELVNDLTIAYNAYMANKDDDATKASYQRATMDLYDYFCDNKRIFEKIIGWNMYNVERYFKAMGMLLFSAKRNTPDSIKLKFSVGKYFKGFDVCCFCNRNKYCTSIYMYTDTLFVDDESYRARLFTVRLANLYIREHSGKVIRNQKYKYFELTEIKHPNLNNIKGRLGYLLESEIKKRKRKYYNEDDDIYENDDPDIE